MPDELEERLRDHARSFDSLLSLIPAKLYYGEDVSDQWKRKKQTPEQKRAAKMAKLDPDNWKSAKDVMDERSAAAKRKRDEDEATFAVPEIMNIETEKPKAQALQGQEPTSKKRKTGSHSAVTATLSSDGLPQGIISTPEDKKQRKAEKKAAKLLMKQKAKDKKQRQKIRKAEVQKAPVTKDGEWSDIPKEIPDTMEMAEVAQGASIIPVDNVAADDVSTASSSAGLPDIMSPPAESGTSSISSIPPDIPSLSTSFAISKPKAKKYFTTEPDLTPVFNQELRISTNSSPPKSPSLERQLQEGAFQQPLESENSEARERLSAAISSFRTQRKADTNPRSRQDLLNSRKVKEEVRRNAKKEQRRKEREEAARLADEEIDRRFSPGGSGSLLGSPRSPPTATDRHVDDSTANNFSFGRVAFGDGTEIDLSNTFITSPDAQLLRTKHRKGPQDVNTALLAAKNKQARLAGLDDEKRSQIEEKDMWLNAKRRAHGERVKDDTSLLKKALKRQEAQKRKSEREWGDRKEGIQKSQEARQKKRTENLAKRKEDKKHGKKTGQGASKKQVKRPGFEGSFRGRSGGSKKK